MLIGSEPYSIIAGKCQLIANVQAYFGRDFTTFLKFMLDKKIVLNDMIVTKKKNKFVIYDFSYF